MIYMEVDPFSSCPKPGLISCLLGEPWCVVVYPTCVSQRRWILSTFPWVKSGLSKLIVVSHFPLPRICLGKGIWQNFGQRNMRGNFLCASEKSFFIERNRHIRKGMSLLPWSYHTWMWHLAVWQISYYQPKKKANTQNKAQQKQWQRSRAKPDTLCLGCWVPALLVMWENKTLIV